jgi:hypothetical protein
MITPIGDRAAAGGNRNLTCRISPKVRRGAALVKGENAGDLSVSLALRDR